MAKKVIKENALVVQDAQMASLTDIQARIYMVRGVQVMLDKRAAGVECTVHTRYTKQTELDFEKHNKQCAEIKKVQLPQHIHDRYLIVDDDVWLLGASVKDIGHGLCTIIKVGFTPEAVLGLLK